MKPLHRATSSDAADETAQLAIETGVRLIRLVRSALRDAPDSALSLSRLRALAYLADNPGICLSDLAELLFVGVPTASKVVDDLVDRGFMKRASDAQDRRRLALTLTERGRRTLDTAVRPGQEQVAELLGRLSPADRTRVRDGLTILGNLLQPSERGADV